MEPGKSFSVQCPGDGNDAYATGRERGKDEAQVICDEAVKEATEKVIQFLCEYPLARRPSSFMWKHSFNFDTPFPFPSPFWRVCVNAGINGSSSPCRCKRCNRRCYRIWRREGKSHRSQRCEGGGAEKSA